MQNRALPSWATRILVVKSWAAALPPRHNLGGEREEARFCKWGKPGGDKEGARRATPTASQAGNSLGVHEMTVVDWLSTLT